MTQIDSSHTGLFAAVNRLDDRLVEYGQPLNKHMLIPSNIFDKAHCVMLCEVGIISTHEAARILKVLQEIDEINVEEFPWGRGDFWAQKEKYIIEQIGEEVGGKLHTGRSRKDVADTNTRLYFRPKILSMANSLNILRQTILEVCSDHIDTVMPCYTYLQHAQPTTLAHYLLSLSYALARDYERIIHSFKLTNLSPAGAAIQTGTSHPLNRHRVSELMGFDAPIRNTRDAVMNYDYLSEIMFSISLSTLDITKIMEDFAIWHSLEFNMISLADAWCGTSSVMPQKRNPYPFSTIRGKASKIFGRTAQMFNTLETPCLGSPSPTYQELDANESIEEFIGILALFNGFLSTMQVNKQVMLERAESYWAQGTDLADMLVKQANLSFRTAHHIVAQLVTNTSKNGIKPRDITSMMINIAAMQVINRPLDLSDEAVNQALDPKLSYKYKKVYGATSPEDILQQIDESRHQLNYDIQLVTKLSDKLNTTKLQLDAAIEEIARNNEAAGD